MDSAVPYNLRYVWAVSLVAAMGGLLFGYDWVVIGGAKPFYEGFFGLDSPYEIGWAMSSALVGCLLGSVVSGCTTDTWGRKPILIASALLFTISALGTALAGSFSGFTFYRLVGGIGIGLASNLSPLYIAELSPAALRGRFVSINQLTIVIGLLSAQIVNWLIARPVPLEATESQILRSWNGQVGWRWMFAAEVVPALLFLVLMFGVPESPRWLVSKGAAAPARRILERIGGSSYANAAVREIEQSLTVQATGVRLSGLLEPALLPVLWLGVFLAVFQQWCGINTIFYYAEEIFTAAGYGVSDVLFNIVITGSVMLVFTLLAVRMVDRQGRKVLMLIGAAGLACVYSLIGLSYYLRFEGLPVLLLVVAAISLYSFTLAPVTWVLIAEIFPNRVRGAAVSVSVFFLWAGCLTLTYTFPILNESLGTAGTYWLYAGICAGGFLVLKRKLVETKGKSLEEIERDLAPST